MKNVINKNNRFYIIRCFNESESFIKTGTTGTTIARRFSGKMPYNLEVIRELKCSVAHSIALEDAIEDMFCQYIHKIKFGGYLECFYSVDLPSIKLNAEGLLEKLTEDIKG